MQGWFLEYEDIQELMGNIGAWIAASGLVPTLGVDRATFCQFLLDLDLVDQNKIPYVWAVSVFDQYAKPVRVCSGDPDYCDPHLEGRLVIMRMVNKWDFMVILDIIC